MANPKELKSFELRVARAMSVSQLASKLHEEPDEAPKYGMFESEVRGLSVREIEELIDTYVDAASQAPFMTSHGRLLYKALGY